MADVMLSEKCKCQHTGHWNLYINYDMGVTVPVSTVKEKGLGITISADMNVSEQYGMAASRGNQILWLIKRTIHTRKKANHTSV